MQSITAESTPNTLDIDDTYIEEDTEDHLNHNVSIGITVPLSQVKFELPNSQVNIHSPIQLPDRYQDLGFLGAGGMGEVRKVEDCILNRPVALKLMHSRFVYEERHRTRFMHEAQIVSQLQHPNILPIYDYGTFEDDTLSYLVWSLSEKKSQIAIVNKELDLMNRLINK